ncbi:MAG: methyltransferase domain-containing protein [Chitinivibrionales bacterium]|nr:methyltransferase domain-containing protein [Chitinivibrionales bacterium]
MRILGTDLSTRMLARAQEGRYTPERIEPVPKHIRQRYFTRQGRRADAVYEVGAKLRSTVVFTRLNLHDVPYPMRGPLDAVFCRNVMIYFDVEGRIRLLQEIERLLKPGGYLFVGHAESLTGMLSAFKSVRPSVYVKKGA